MTSAQAIKWLLWDFDGTLARREGGWVGTLLSVLQRHAPKLGITADHIRPHLQTGFPWHTPQLPHTQIKDADQWWLALAPVFQKAFMAVGVAERQAHELAIAVRPAYLEPAKWMLYEDTLPALRQLSMEGWSHAILSNHCFELPEIMRNLGLADHFSRVFNSAQTGYEKPHPEAFRAAVAAIGAVSSIWMIGDSVAADVAGAIAAGLSAILVRKSDPAARYCCRTLTELPKMLSELVIHLSKPVPLV